MPPLLVPQSSRAWPTTGKPMAFNSFPSGRHASCRGRSRSKNTVPFRGSFWPAAAAPFAKACPYDDENAHHFARRTHLRPKNRIHAAKLVEWKHRRLHRIKIMHRNLRHATMTHQRQINLSSFLPAISPGCNFGQRHSRGFADERYSARSSRIHFPARIRYPAESHTAHSSVPRL